MAVVKITTPAQLRAVFGKNNMNLQFSDGLLNLLRAKNDSIVYIAGSAERSPVLCLESELGKDVNAVPTSFDYKKLSQASRTIKFLSNKDMDKRIAKMVSDKGLSAEDSPELV